MLSGGPLPLSRPANVFMPTLSVQTDYKASGVQLPPNWVGGYRTRSTDMSPYKV